MKYHLVSRKNVNFWKSEMCVYEVLISVPMKITGEIIGNFPFMTSNFNDFQRIFLIKGCVYNQIINPLTSGARMIQCQAAEG